ncbi:amidase signature enzyme [Macroventuria anomochaeta]|uniref:Amidase signature enzyme n=1 Tax=Macroventuria anomochaeta TaxID=301207 RepID=A0ACB6RJK8_9PLEO|nr:amidase signature enzyme [Macroventuria anomochaeta]KAF2621872.1 amidase signature enzyme [Macroventuria anomochaeta]
MTQYPVTISGINLLSASAEEVAAALEAGNVTTLQLVDAYIARIEANDHQGLNLRSMIEIAPSAREVAARLDAERANGTIRSILHGVPIVVKDNFNTAKELGMNTTAGSYALLGTEVRRDAFVISRLRDAGVLMLGKANLQEWAGEMGRYNSSAWSARGGQCQSAYVIGGFNAGGDPSGSSSGSAVAVSAGFAAAALGTDTEASIVSPSNRAALYGLRPSTGITSRVGVVPISSSQDTTGPMAKSVWDIAALFEIMAVHDDEDAYSAAANPFRHKNYTQFLNPDGFQGLRIGIPREPFWNQTYQGYRSTINAGLEATFEKMRSLGATIIDPIEFPNAKDWKYSFVGQATRTNNGTVVVQYDVKEDMEIYLTTELANSSHIRTLYDIISFNERNVDLEFPPGKCCQDTFLAADQLGPRNTSGDYWYAKWLQQRLNEEGIEYAFREYTIDLLLVPTEGSSARLGAIGRCPVGNVPVGYDEINLPYGMSFVGRRYDEPMVIRAMSAYEANFPARRVPPTLD